MVILDQSKGLVHGGRIRHKHPAHILHSRNTVHVQGAYYLFGILVGVVHAAVNAVHNLPHMGIADGIGSFGGKQLCFAVERVHVGRYLNILAVGAAYHAECVIFKCIRSHVSSPFPYLSFIQQYTKNGLLIQCWANRIPAARAQ